MLDHRLRNLHTTSKLSIHISTHACRTLHDEHIWLEFLSHPRGFFDGIDCNEDECLVVARGIVRAHLRDVLPQVTAICEQDNGDLFVECSLHELRTRPVEDPSDEPHTDEMLFL